jgi:uncharacterized protein DUF2730
MNFEFDMTVTLSLILSFGTLVFAWFRTRKKDVDERFHTGSKRMDELDRRTSKLEQTVDTMPGKDHLHRLELSLSDISGDLKAIRATMRAQAEAMVRIESVVGRHEEHLLDGGKDK